MKTIFNGKARAWRWVAGIALAATISACGGGSSSDVSGTGGGPPPILDPVNNANAVDDVFPAIQSVAGGSTAPVQLNDLVTIDGITTAAVLGTNASIAAVTRTSAAPAAGSITLNTSTGVVTVAAGTSAGAYAFTYQLCRTAPNQTVCDIATASGTVTTTPPASNIVTRADLLACPISENLVSSNAWSNCLAGKRLVGSDLLNPSQACQLLFLGNGRVEYTHNGVAYTPKDNTSAVSGFYQNSTGVAAVFIGTLDFDFTLGVMEPSNQLQNISVGINISVAGGNLLNVGVANTDPATGSTTVFSCKLTDF